MRVVFYYLRSFKITDKKKLRRNRIIKEDQWNWGIKEIARVGKRDNVKQRGNASEIRRNS